MESISSSDLKSILHSKRANIYYLEHCRVLVNGGRVEYVTDEGKQSLYWNIPIANTTSILLGTGTSITQAAMRELAKAGVLVGFCGGGGTPLFSANDVDVEVSWLNPQSEYRPTQYLQDWVSFWFDEGLRLEAAKRFQKLRLRFLSGNWLNNKKIHDQGFVVSREKIEELIENAMTEIDKKGSSIDLLTAEARLTKKLYQLAADTMKYGEFTRSKRGESIDPANRFLDHGNYLAYGLGATATWVLGIPHGLAVLHGKTRRGGLVFDVADLVKDALVLPTAFIAAVHGDSEQVFRQRCIQQLTQAEALDFMIKSLQQIAQDLSRVKA
ncbi:type I-F CRISPR-associated endonuclease Cas1f [Paenalcaligenes hermetiae]|uniref:CRISPR-associated endonuclease Cas1 n=1 Tax=Paenalcaligenes hermetiae TaxID=1157987 RepID=A0ABP9M1S7_9BURK